MKKRAGKKSSPLDQFRPTNWHFDDELLRLMWVLEATINMVPELNVTLSEILDSQLWNAADLPSPTTSEREALVPVEDEELALGSQMIFATDDSE